MKARLRGSEEADTVRQRTFWNRDGSHSRWRRLRWPRVNRKQRYKRRKFVRFARSSSPSATSAKPSPSPGASRPRTRRGCRFASAGGWSSAPSMSAIGSSPGRWWRNSSRRTSSMRCAPHRPAVTAAQAQFTEAQNNYERQKFLLARDVASRVQYERAEQTRDTAQAQLDSAAGAAEDRPGSGGRHRAEGGCRRHRDRAPPPSPAKWSRPDN